MKRSSGAGSVFQRSDGMWVAQIRRMDESKGKSVKVRKYSKSRTGARELLKELQGANPVRPVPNMRLVDYLSGWVKVTLPRLGLSDATVHAYTNDVRWIITPTLGETRLAAFTPTEAERWLDRVDLLTSRKGEPLSQPTKRRAFAALSKALTTAVRDGLIEGNPLLKVSRPPVSRSEVRTMTGAEVDAALVAVQDRRVEPLAVFVAYTGVRLSEALAVRWADVGDGQVLIRGTKSKSAHRAVPLLPEAGEVLDQWRKVQRRERMLLGAGWSAADHVFTTGTGRVVGDHQARRDLVAALKAAGLPTARPWHSFRHSLAGRLLNRGVPMPVVSRILGHSSIRVTVDTYGSAEPAINATAMAQALAR